MDHGAGGLEGVAGTPSPGTTDVEAVFLEQGQAKARLMLRGYSWGRVGLMLMLTANERVVMARAEHSDVPNERCNCVVGSGSR